MKKYKKLFAASAVISMFLVSCTEDRYVYGPQLMEFSIQSGSLSDRNVLTQFFSQRSHYAINAYGNISVYGADSTDCMSQFNIKMNGINKAVKSEVATYIIIETLDGRMVYTCGDIPGTLESLR